MSVSAFAAAVPAPLVHRSARMAELTALLRRVAGSDANVLISGESGTGKDVVARQIHDAGRRRERPFVTLACAAVPAELLESELFGHEKGAFTGAVDRRVGRFEQADGGSLVLDGVEELAPPLQGKLLRVVQERAFERLAGTRTLRVDVRLLSTTQVDLARRVESGGFRRDLYYRLDVVRVEVPALRDRMEDVPVLAEHILREFGDPAGAPLRLAPAALARLMSHDWPGNVRELRNVLQAAALACSGAGEIPAAAIAAGTARGRGPAAGAGDECTLAELEERHIRAVLSTTGGHRGKAAKILGINRKTLLEKRKRYGIP